MRAEMAVRVCASDEVHQGRQSARVRWRRENGESYMVWRASAGRMWLDTQAREHVSAQAVDARRNRAFGGGKTGGYVGGTHMATRSVAHCTVQVMTGASWRQMQFAGVHVRKWMLEYMTRDFYLVFCTFGGEHGK